ncbi:MAG: hypothetical protein IJU29_07495 [Oscillospiraceae bacterium]|nr:hypothetical protein [Oscillospiraceae bacterium]
MDRKSLMIWIAGLCLAAALSGCGAHSAQAPEQDAPQAAGTAVPVSTAAPVDVPGVETQTEISAVSRSGLSGSYYNDYLRLTLTLAEHGTYTLRGEDSTVSGSYSAGENGVLVLDFASGSVEATAASNGDLLLAGYPGYFLADWDFWGITEEEAGYSAETPVVISAPADGTQITENLDGTLRYLVPDQRLAFTAPADMTVLWGAVAGGVAIADPQGGFVTGRNVTDLYRTSSDTDDAFAEDYVRAFVTADLSALRGTADSYADVTLVRDAPEGRVAAVSLTLTANGQPFSVLTVIYTSTFSDGTVNYIAKTVYAPAAEEAGVQRLSEAVRDVAALRSVPKEN